MFARIRWQGLTALLLLLVVAAPVAAGGWATVTVDELPREVRAGETIQIGFTVRQHGQHPVDLTEPAPLLSARNPETGDSLEVEARQEGPTGHHVADVTFPSAGVWEWGIAPAPFPVVTLAPLTVLPAATANTSFDVTSLWTVVAVGTLLAAGLGVSVRRGTIGGPSALVVGATGLAIALVVVFVATTAPSTAAAPVEPTNVDASYGRALFVAKGCAGCHRHAAVDVAWSTGMGPNLTNYEPAPDFVRAWLRDPQAIRPETMMPNLELSDEEIDALIAFLAAE